MSREIVLGCVFFVSEHAFHFLFDEGSAKQTVDTMKPTSGFPSVIQSDYTIEAVNRSSISYSAAIARSLYMARCSSCRTRSLDTPSLSACLSTKQQAIDCLDVTRINAFKINPRPESVSPEFCHAVVLIEQSDLNSFNSFHLLYRIVSAVATVQIVHFVHFAPTET